MFIGKIEISDEHNEGINSAMEKYAEHLSKLNRQDLEAALDSFRQNLASKGIFITIRILDLDEQPQTSSNGL